jgi:hypothetical protein
MPILPSSLCFGTLGNLYFPDSLAARILDIKQVLLLNESISSMEGGVTFLTLAAIFLISKVIKN